MTNSQSDTLRQPNQQDNEEDENLDLGALIATILNEKYLIASVALIFLGLGVFKTQLTIPSYKADAMVQVEEKSNALDALSGVMSLMESAPLALTEIEIIKSRQILGAAVKDLHLDIVATPKYFPIVGKAIARRFQAKNLTGEVSTPLFGRDQYAWGGEKIQLDTFFVPENLIGKGLILLAGEQGHFTLKDEDDQTLLEGEVGKPVMKKLDNSEDTISLFISSLKARKGTQFTVTKKSLLSTITELDKSLTVAEKGKKTGILSFSIEDPSAATAAKILNQVTNSYVKQNVEQKSKEAQTTLEFLDKQLPAIKEQLEAATTALNEFRTEKGSIDLSIETAQILKSVVEITGQLTLLQQQKDELRGRFTEAHPTVVALDKQIARLQAQINSSDKKIEILPETQQVILRLTRDVQVSSELYTALLNSAQTLRVAKAGTVGNVRIIDEAVLPSEPVDSKKSLIIAVSLILGLVVGVGVTFIRKALHRGVQNPDQIEKHLHIPVYATILHSKAQEELNQKRKKSGKQLTGQNFVLALEDKDDLAIESLRSLRTTLHFAFLEAKNNIIMITGPSPGIGKSFIAINLAIVLADAGKKILLIDGDLRRGSCNKNFGISREDGLSDLISNSITLEKAVHHIASANIDFIPTGSIPPNPSELLMHERFIQLLETLGKNYDHIIIDSPPILAVTDAGIIGHIASATLMVVKSGQHPMRELEVCAKRLTQTGVDIKGIVFNDLPEKTSGSYGYGYGYGYGYQYSYKKSTAAASDN